MNHLKILRHIGLVVMALGFLPAAGLGLCAEQKKPDGASAEDSGTPANDIKQFCVNNAAAVGDARIAWQTSKLRELEKEINQRLGELDSKKAQLAEWMRKRDEAMQKANAAVIAIYAQMKPTAAAQNLSAMEDSVAAAIIAKLSPRAASAGGGCRFCGHLGGLRRGYSRDWR
jgi:flagellar motility protein MotE (MotC chaperone)